MSAQPPRRAPDDAVPSRPGSSFVRRLAMRAKAGSSSESRRGLFKGLAAAWAFTLRTIPPRNSRRCAPATPTQIRQTRTRTTLASRTANRRRTPSQQSEHEKALKDAETLVSLSNQLKDDIQKAGNFVVPVSALRKTQEIEKLARSVRTHLQS